MTRPSRCDQASNPTPPKPYVMVGAGQLSSAVWKTQTAGGDWKYQFNIFALNGTNGSVEQQFLPEDVIDLAKLTNVLASVLVDDGCIDPKLRQDLRHLAKWLDMTFDND